MRASQKSNNLKLRHRLWVCCVDPGLVDIALKLNRLLLLRKPILMVEREPRDREKQQDGKACHRYVDVQPTGIRGQLALPQGLDAGFGPSPPSGDPPCDTSCHRVDLVLMGR